MTPADPPPPADLSTPPAGPNPPAWPDVSKMSRGYRVPVGVGAALAVVVTAVCAFGTLSTRPHREGAAPPAATPSPVATPDPTSQALPTPADPAAAAREGDCLTFTGPPSSPTPALASCSPDAYLVVRRFDGTADTDLCRLVPGSNSWYRHTDPAGSRSFVLCLHH
jgi:hypothetical protein